MQEGDFSFWALFVLISDATVTSNNQQSFGPISGAQQEAGRDLNFPGLGGENVPQGESDSAPLLKEGNAQPTPDLNKSPPQFERFMFLIV